MEAVEIANLPLKNRIAALKQSKQEGFPFERLILKFDEKGFEALPMGKKLKLVDRFVKYSSDEKIVDLLRNSPHALVYKILSACVKLRKTKILSQVFEDGSEFIPEFMHGLSPDTIKVYFKNYYNSPKIKIPLLWKFHWQFIIDFFSDLIKSAGSMISTRNAHYQKLFEFCTTRVTSQDQALALMKLLIELPPMNHPVDCEFLMNEISTLDIRYFSLHTYGFIIYQEVAELLPFAFYIDFIKTQRKPFWRQLGMNFFKDVLFSKKFKAFEILQVLELVKGKASLKDYSNFTYDYHTDQDTINQLKFNQELCVATLAETSWMDRLSISELENVMMGLIPSSEECKKVLAVDHNSGKNVIMKWIDSNVSVLQSGHLKVMERLKSILMHKSEKGMQSLVKFYQGIVKKINEVIIEVKEMIGCLALEIREIDSGFETILGAVNSIRASLNTLLSRVLSSKIEYLNIDEIEPECHSLVKTFIKSLKKTFIDFEDGFTVWVSIWKDQLLSSLNANLLRHCVATKYQSNCLQRFNQKVFPLLLTNLRLLSFSHHQETIDDFMKELEKFTDPQKFDTKAESSQFAENFMSLIGDFLARCLRLSKPKQVTTLYLKKILEVYTLRHGLKEPLNQWKSSRIYDTIGKCVTLVGSNVIPLDNSVLDCTNFFDDQLLKMLRNYLKKAVEEEQDGEPESIKVMLASIWTTWSQTLVLTSIVELILENIKNNEKFLMFFAEKWDKSENFAGLNNGFDSIITAYLDTSKFQKVLFRYTRRLQTLANDLLTRDFQLQQYLSRIEQYAYRTQSWMKSNLWIDELKRIQPTIQRIEWDRNDLHHPIENSRMWTVCFDHPIFGNSYLIAEGELIRRPTFFQTKENFANLSSLATIVFADVWNAEPKYYPTMVSKVTNYILQHAIRNFVTLTALKAVKSSLLIEADLDYYLEIAKNAITFCFESLLEVKIRQLGRDSALLNFVPPNIIFQFQMAFNTALNYIDVYTGTHERKVLESEIRYSSIDFLKFWAALHEKGSPNFPIKLGKSLPVNFAFLEYFSGIKSLSEIINIANPVLLDAVQVLTKFLAETELTLQSPLYAMAMRHFQSLDMNPYLKSTSQEMTDYTSLDVAARVRGGLFFKPTANQSIVPLLSALLNCHYRILEKTEERAVLNSALLVHSFSIVRFRAVDSKQFNSRAIRFETFKEYIHKLLEICKSSAQLTVVKEYLLEYEPKLLLDMVEMERINPDSKMFTKGKFSSHDEPVKEKYQFEIENCKLDINLAPTLQTRISKLAIDLILDEQEKIENKIRAAKLLPYLDVVSVLDIETLAKNLSSGSTPPNAKLKEAVYGSILYKLDDHVNISKVILSPSVIGDRDVSVRLLDSSVRLIDKVGDIFLEDFSKLLSDSTDENLKSLGVATMKSLIRLIMRSTKSLGVLIQLWKKSGFAEPVVVCLLNALLNILVVPGLEGNDQHAIMKILNDFGRSVVAEKPQPLVVACIAAVYPAKHLIHDYFNKIPPQTFIHYYFVPSFQIDYSRIDVEDLQIANGLVKLEMDIAKHEGIGGEQGELSRAIGICGLSSWLGMDETLNFEIFQIYKTYLMNAIIQIEPTFDHPERLCEFCIKYLEIIGKYYKARMAEGHCAHPELSSNALIFKPILQDFLKGAKASSSNDITYSNLKKVSLIMDAIKGAEMKGFEGIDEVEIGRQQKVFEMYSEVYREIKKLSKV